MRSNRTAFHPTWRTWLLIVATVPGPGWARAGDDSVTESALGEALSVGLALGEGRERDWLLEHIGIELARAHRFEEARRAASAIDFASWRFSVLRVIAEEQAEAGDAETALRTVAEINDASGFYSHDNAVKRVALALLEAGSQKEAIRAARHCRQSAMEASTIGALMSARAEADDLDGMYSIQSAFDAPGFQAPEKVQAVALASVARILVERGNVKEAKHLSGKNEAEPLILGAIAEACVESGNLELAAKFARRVLTQGADWETEAKCHVALIRNFCSRGKIDEAERIAREPWQQPEIQMGALVPRSLSRYESQAARAIAGAYVERDEMEKANEALSHLAVHSHVLALIDLADARDKANDRATADRVLTLAEQTAESRKLGFYYQSLGAAQIRFGRVEAARQSFAKAMRAKNIGTSLNQRAIVTTQARAGDADGALRNLEVIENLEIRDQARAWIAATLARQGKADEALEVARSIAERMIRSTTLAQLGRAFADTNEPARALATCRLAAETAGSESLPPEAAGIIAQAWASTAEGHPEARAWAHRIQNEQARAAALLGVARGGLGRPISPPPDSPYVVPTPR